MEMSSQSSKSITSIVWFRKGLRLHDNPALVEACKVSKKLYPVFVIDPHFAKPNIVGVNRYNFLLQSLIDLDTNLRAVGSRLYVVRGRPDEEIPKLIDRWNVQLLSYELDTEPYARKRDDMLCKLLQSYTADKSVQVKQFCSHTLFHPELYVSLGKGNIPNSYQGFQKLFSLAGDVREPLKSPTFDDMPHISDEDRIDSTFDVPTLLELGYDEIPSTQFQGGESEALKRMHMTVVNRAQWVASFEKPMTSPNSLEPSTTVLSPYLKFGCLSASLFYHELAGIYNKFKNHSQPPVSLHGQLLWREFFYFASYTTPNFDKMEGNPNCRQIPWERDSTAIAAWKEGRTGYPFIDAIMTQLRVEGWIHHLARHAVACFLTRGDLWQHWEEGVRVFDLYLLDDDWALNNANWQWLSCSNFFYQYFRCYSPVAFGKKTDPEGLYIKKWLPQLKDYPTKYIYEPWRAPIDVQQRCKCVIGKDYPYPIVDHDIVSKENMNKMKVAYNAQKGGAAESLTEDGSDEVPAKSASKSSKSSSKTSKKRPLSDDATQSQITKFMKKS